MNPTEPITIKEYKVKTQQINDFEDKEWAKANKLHFGKNVQFKIEKYLFKATGPGGEILGTIDIEMMGKVTFVSSIIVTSEHRRKSVGRLLMEKAEKIAWSKGCHKIWLTTGDRWESVRFYQRIGYSQTGKLQNHFYKKDFVIFEKMLS